MNREIKFRVWHDNLMWKHGSLQFDMLPFELSQKTFFEFDGIESGEIITGGSSQDFTLMQYTGLKDKNGKEIYEGDIIQSELQKTVFQVQWNQVECRFEAFMKSEHRFYPPDNWPLFGVAIGNIYETPELLPENAIISPEKKPA